MLLQVPAQLMLAFDHGITPLMLAAQSDKYEAAKLLLDFADGATKQMLLAIDHQGAVGLPIAMHCSTCRRQTAGTYVHQHYCNIAAKLHKLYWNATSPRACRMLLGTYHLHGHMPLPAADSTAL